MPQDHHDHPHQQEPPSVHQDPHSHPHQQGQHLPLHQEPPQRHRYRLHPKISPTSPIAWLAAIFCMILWVIIILGGLVVLIIYLVFRPKSPRLDISSVTLNGAYLDTDNLLNADVTILANFSNPNHKVDVSFSYLAMDLYFGDTLIATQAIDPFSERRGESELRSVHMVTSLVALTQKEVDAWKKQVESNMVMLEVRGLFRTRSNLGSVLHFSYWLYGRCSIVVSDPPSGALLSSKCRTKR